MNIPHLAQIALLLLLLVANHTVLGDQSTERLVETVMPAVVAIRVETNEGISSGTGFIVESAGVVVTNLHVIAGAQRVEVKLNSGEQYSQIKVGAFDDQRDLAILRLPGFELPIVKLGNSDDVSVGETVIAIGNPLGLEQSVTRGIISSVRVLESGTKVIQTDSAASPGNSGGPLVNESGEVIGIVTFKVEQGEGLNFALPINYARALMSFSDLMSLEDMNNRLSASAESLFEDDPTGGSLNGTWLSLTHNFQQVMRQDGDYLYGSFDLENVDGTYDMIRQEDGTYRGKVRGSWQGSYNSAWDGRLIIENCAYEEDIELTKISPTRIEGRQWSFVWPESNSKIKKAIKTCGSSLADTMKWHEFVWVLLDQ